MEQLSCWALFHLSSILKVIADLQTSPWNFWKLQNRPFLPPPPPCSVLAAAHRRHRRRRRGEASRPPFSVALAPTRRAAPPPPPVASRWSPRPCHACRRVQKHPRRRHLAVAVERPLHSPPLFSLARIRTRELSLIFSPRPLALSLPRLPGTPPPLHRTPASLKLPSSRTSTAAPPKLTPPLASP